MDTSPLQGLRDRSMAGTQIGDFQLCIAHSSLWRLHMTSWVVLRHPEYGHLGWLLGWRVFSKHGQLTSRPTLKM